MRFEANRDFEAAKRFGALVHSKRKEKLLTQIDLAKAVGQGQANISKIEDGRIIVRADVASRICKFLKIHGVVLVQIFNDPVVDQVEAAS